MTTSYHRSSNTDSRTMDFARRTKLLLNDSEQQYMYDILREYRTCKQLNALVLSLRFILDTPVKMDLLKDVREFVDPSHLTEYDRLVPYQKMANPWSDEFMQELSRRRRVRAKDVKKSKQKKLPSTLQEHAGLNNGVQTSKVNSIAFDSINIKDASCILYGAPRPSITSQSEERASTSKSHSEKILWYDVSRQGIIDDGFVEHDFLKLFKPNSRIYRKVFIDVRAGRRNLGFNIRGGSEYDLGIYVSSVDSGGVGENSGVRVGDRMMVANGIGFDNISHREAVKLLQSHRQLFLILLFVGFYPICKVIDDEDVSDLREPYYEERLSRLLANEKQRKLNALILKDTGLNDVDKLMLKELKERQETLKFVEKAACRLHRLNDDEIRAIVRHTNHYLRNGDVKGFAVPLMAILDTAERQQLLICIRQLIKRKHLPLFDEITRSTVSADVSNVYSSQDYREDKNDSLWSVVDQRAKAADSSSQHFKRRTIISSSSVSPDVISLSLTDSDRAHGLNESSDSNFPLIGNDLHVKAKGYGSLNISSQSLRNSNGHHKEMPSNKRAGEYSIEDKIGDKHVIQPQDIFQDGSTVMKANWISKTPDNPDMHFGGSNGGGTTIDNSGSDQEYFGTDLSRTNMNDVHQHDEVRQRSDTDISVSRNNYKKWRSFPDLSGPNDHGTIKHRSSETSSVNKTKRKVDSYEQSRTSYENDNCGRYQKDFEPLVLNDSNRHRHERDKLADNALPRTFMQYKSGLDLHDPGQNDSRGGDLQGSNIRNPRNFQEHKIRTSLDTAADTNSDRGYRKRLDSDLLDQNQVGYKREALDQPTGSTNLNEGNYQKIDLPGDVQDSSLRKSLNVSAGRVQDSSSLDQRKSHPEGQTRGTASEILEDGSNKIGQWDNDVTILRNRLKAEENNSKTSGKVEAGIYQGLPKKPHPWSWNSSHRPRDTGGTTLNSSVTSALQLLDKALQSEEASTNDYPPISHRQKTLSRVSSAASSESNLTSTSGRYDVTAPPVTSSVNTEIMHRELSPSRFHDSGHDSDYKSNNSTLGRLPPHNEHQMSHNTEFNSTSHYESVHDNRPPSLYGNLPGSSLNNWGFSTAKNKKQLEKMVL